MDCNLDVVNTPVRDVDRSLDFYTTACGFRLDVDYYSTATFRAVQLTPPGSSCSLQIGLGLTDAEPGASRSLCLAVSDIQDARRELLGRGVAVEAIRRKASIEHWQGNLTDGLDAGRRDYASFASFADPDGNTWTPQQIDLGCAIPGAPT